MMRITIAAMLVTPRPYDILDQRKQKRVCMPYLACNVLTFFWSVQTATQQRSAVVLVFQLSLQQTKIVTGAVIM